MLTMEKWGAYCGEIYSVLDLWDNFELSLVSKKNGENGPLVFCAYSITRVTVLLPICFMLGGGASSATCFTVLNKSVSAGKSVSLGRVVRFLADRLWNFVSQFCSPRKLSLSARLPGRMAAV